MEVKRCRIIFCCLFFLYSCGFDKVVYYKAENKEVIDLSNDTFASSLRFENVENDLFRFSFFCRPLVNDSILLKDISFSLHSNKEQISKHFDFLNIEIEKYEHQKPTYYKTVTDVNFVNDTFKIISGKSSSTTLFFTYKDIAFKKERNLELNVDFILLLKNCKKEFTIKKTIFLKRKNEYTYWILRNC